MTKIFYFSGTGNSLWSAKKIKEIIDNTNPEPQENSLDVQKCELINIGVVMQNISAQNTKKNSEIIIEADSVVIVFPSYAYGMPLVVKRFYQNTIFKTPYVASLVTYGSSPLGTLGSVKTILKKKKIEKTFYANIPAVENYLAMFGTPKKKTITERCNMQEKATTEAALSIIKRKENYVFGFYPFSFLVSNLFYLGIKLFYKWYRVSDNCSGCGVCEKICPVSAVKIKKGQPVFTSKCEHCQGCVNICPLRVIQFARVRYGTEGYCHPKIKLNELMIGKEAVYITH